MKELKDKSDLRNLKEETEKEGTDLTKVKEVRDLTKVLDATNVRNLVILPNKIMCRLDLMDIGIVGFGFITGPPQLQTTDALVFVYLKLNLRYILEDF